MHAERADRAQTPAPRAPQPVSAAARPCRLLHNPQLSASARQVYTHMHTHNAPTQPAEYATYPPELLSPVPLTRSFHLLLGA